MVKDGNDSMITRLVSDIPKLGMGTTPSKCLGQTRLRFLVSSEINGDQ